MVKVNGEGQEEVVKFQYLRRMLIEVIEVWMKRRFVSYTGKRKSREY